MSKKPMVQIKLVEVGEIPVAQQALPGMGSREVNSVPFEREHLKGMTSLDMVVNGAMGMLVEIYKKNRLEVRINNTQGNRWETVFTERGQSDVNPDEITEDPKSDKVASLDKARGRKKKGDQEEGTGTGD